MRRIAALLAFIVLTAAFAGVAEAKGGPSYLTGGTVSGGDIPAPASFNLTLPDNRYPVRALHAPANGIVLPQPQLQALEAKALPYEVVLHYDYQRYGGQRDWVARFDGEDLLYFAKPLNSIDAGWYRATPALVEELRWARVPPQLRVFKPERGLTSFHRVVFTFGVAALIIGALYVRRARPANVSPLQMQERMSMRDLHLGPGFRP